MNKKLYRLGFTKHFAHFVARSGAHGHGKYTSILLSISLPLVLAGWRRRVQSKLWCINCSFLVFDSSPALSAFCSFYQHDSSIESRRVSRHLSITSAFLFFMDNRPQTLSRPLFLFYVLNLLFFSLAYNCSFTQVIYNITYMQNLYYTYIYAYFMYILYFFSLYVTLMLDI